MQHTMSQDEKYRMMTENPIPGLIGRLAVPTIISMLVTSFYNMADTFFVGRIGTSATAAVGVAFPVMAVIQALGFFCGHGSGNSISRKLGAQENDAAGELAATGFFVGMILGLLVLVLGLLFLTPLSRILGSTDTILPYTREYLGIILVGAPWMTAQFVLNNQIRFQGNAFYAMIGVGTGAVLNIILDPILIFGFRMGISGAALATVFSQLISFFLLLAGVHFSGCIPIRLKNVRFHRERLREIAGGGLPSLFRQGLGSVATMTLNIAANPYGDAAIAAMSVVSRIFMFAISALIGFGQGFQPVCGFNYGAKKYGRVREAFWFCVKVSTIFLFALSILGFLLSGHLIGIFRDDPDRDGSGPLPVRHTDPEWMDRHEQYDDPDHGENVLCFSSCIRKAGAVFHPDPFDPAANPGAYRNPVGPGGGRSLCVPAVRGPVPEGDGGAQCRGGKANGIAQKNK